MADFWGGFGQGFAPSFEKALDRRRAEEKRLAEIERLDEVAKQERLGRLIGYKGALGEEKFRELLPESGQTPISPKVYPPDSIWTGAGPLPRQYRSLEDVMGGMGKKDRIGLEMAAKLRYAAKLEEDKREEAARLLLDKYEHEKGLLSAKQLADDFKADFEATKADLQAKASSGVTEIPLGRLSPFREGQQKRLRIFFDTAVTDYNNASVVERDERYLTRLQVLAPYAAFQSGYIRPALPKGSKLTEGDADEVWEAHRLGEGEIVKAKASGERVTKKAWDLEDLSEARVEVESELKDWIRAYSNLRKGEWSDFAGEEFDRLNERIRVPEDAYKMVDRARETAENIQLLNAAKDSDFFGKEAQGLIKSFMANPSVRSNGEAIDFLMKNISPEKPAAVWEDQFAEYKRLGDELLKPGLTEAERAKLEDHRAFLHSRGPARQDASSITIGALIDVMQKKGIAPRTPPDKRVDPAPTVPPPTLPPDPQTLFEPPPVEKKPAPKGRGAAILIDDLTISAEEKAALKSSPDGFKLTDGDGVTYEKVGDSLFPIKPELPTLPPLPGAKE